MSRPRLCKELTKIERRVVTQGWTWRFTNGGHVLWLGPLGQRIISASTTSDRRAYKNLTSRLRREGADL